MTCRLSPRRGESSRPNEIYYTTSTNFTTQIQGNLLRESKDLLHKFEIYYTNSTKFTTRTWTSWWILHVTCRLSPGRGECAKSWKRFHAPPLCVRVEALGFMFKGVGFIVWGVGLGGGGVEEWVPLVGLVDVRLPGKGFPGSLTSTGVPNPVWDWGVCAACLQGGARVPDQSALSCPHSAAQTGPLPLPETLNSEP